MAWPTEPLIVSLWINWGGRTMSSWPAAAEPTEVGAIETFIVMDDALRHTTVTGGVVVVAVTGDIMRNTLQRTSTIFIATA